MTHYHNTNKESGATLAQSEAKAKSQEDKVMEFFTAFGDSYHFTPDAVLQYGDFPDTPITSIRRAMTNLKKQGKLMKTENMEIGSYGKRVHTWKLHSK